MIVCICPNFYTILKLQCLLTSLFSNLKGTICFHKLKDQLLTSKTYMLPVTVSLTLVRGGADRYPLRPTAW